MEKELSEKELEELLINYALFDLISKWFETKDKRIMKEIKRIARL